jgi:hypothetical protein
VPINPGHIGLLYVLSLLKRQSRDAIEALSIASGVWKNALRQNTLVTLLVFADLAIGPSPLLKVKDRSVMMFAVLGHVAKYSK